METYKIQKLSELAEIPAHQLRYWDRIGLLKPSVKETAGRGFPRLYSEEDVTAAQIIGRLKREGASLQKIRKAVARIQENMLGKNIWECTFRFDGKKVVVPDVDTWFKEQLKLPFAKSG
jgi:DNA-binding transcriptional MerR regulator